MKVKDCWRLAQISLNSRKKATKNTVRGIAVSIIIIIPLIFCILGLNISVKEQINSHPQLLHVTFDSTQSGFKWDRDIDAHNSLKYGNSYNRLIDSNLEDKSQAFKQFENDFIHYVSIVENLDSWKGYCVEESIVLDGMPKPFNLRKFTGIKNECSELSVVAQNSLDKLAEDKMGILGETYNKGFTGDGARQVILSERYLAMAGLKAEDVYGKRITINVKEKPVLDSNFIFKVPNDINAKQINYSLFQDFEVVGIIKSDNGVSESTQSGYDEIIDYNYTYYSDIQNSNIIISSASYYGEDGKPAISHDYFVDGENIVCDVGDINAKNAMTKDYIFCGVNCYNSYAIYADRVGNNNDFTGKLMFLEVNSYKFLPSKYSTKAFDELSEIMEKVYPLYSDKYPSVQAFKMSANTSSTYNEYSFIELFIRIILIVLSVFSLVVLVVALINLFVTIMHSVRSRKHYLALLRAIGARAIEIPKLYFFEIIRLLAKAMIWIVCLGSLFCIIAKVCIDTYLTKLIGLSISGIAISMPWYLIVAVILAFAVVLFLVGVIYAFVCSFKLARDPIVKSLEN